jgi:hypothetical protein
LYDNDGESACQSTFIIAQSALSFPDNFNAKFHGRFGGLPSPLAQRNNFKAKIT